MTRKKISGHVMQIALVLCVLLPGISHATFSIVAVDTVTGTVGGAGASCIAGSQMINDVIEGVGAIHTQAWYLSGNQSNAHNLMVSGLAPDSIISWLYWNDVEADPDWRQYLAVTLAGPADSYAFTGANTSYWKGHAYGPGYAIAGNILLGPEIVADMETAYLTTEGPLEAKLMAAMAAANVAGADTRCMSCDKPAISAFIKVVRLGDGATPYLHKIVNNTICAENPVDSLFILYNDWQTTKLADADESTVELEPTILPHDCPDTAIVTVTPLNNEGAPPIDGVTEVTLTSDASLSAVVDNGDGTYSATVYAPENQSFEYGDIISASVTAGATTVGLNQEVTINYFYPGSPNGDDTGNILDITYLISYLYKGGPAPNPIQSGDIDGNYMSNILDITYYISYLYKGGPAPVCPPMD